MTFYKIRRRERPRHRIVAFLVALMAVFGGFTVITVLNPAPASAYCIDSAPLRPLCYVVYMNADDADSWDPPIQVKCGNPIGPMLIYTYWSSQGGMYPPGSTANPTGYGCTSEWGQGVTAIRPYDTQSPNITRVSCYNAGNSWPGNTYTVVSHDDGSWRNLPPAVNGYHRLYCRTTHINSPSRHNLS